MQSFFAGIPVSRDNLAVMEYLKTITEQALKHASTAATTIVGHNHSSRCFE